MRLKSGSWGVRKGEVRFQQMLVPLERGFGQEALAVRVKVHDVDEALMLAVQGRMRIHEADLRMIIRQLLDQPVSKVKGSLPPCRVVCPHR